MDKNFGCNEKRFRILRTTPLGFHKGLLKCHEGVLYGVIKDSFGFQEATAAPQSLTTRPSPRCKVNANVRPLKKKGLSGNVFYIK